MNLHKNARTCPKIRALMDDKKTGARTRARAAEAVDAVVTQGRSLDSALPEAEKSIKPSEHGLLRALCYGTLRFHWRIRSQLGVLLDRPLKAHDSVIESLLAVGIYQLTDTRIPDHAAVSVTVEASRVLRRPKYARRRRISAANVLFALPCPARRYTVRPCGCAGT